MKLFHRLLFAIAVLLGGVTHSVAVTVIDWVGIYTSNSGVWQTGAAAAIGISDPGSTSNPFYNDLSSGAILPPGILSGTYLAFMGYESYWPMATAELALHYTNGSTRNATFLVGDIHASGDWVRILGDPGLWLGGGGFAVTPDRVGTSTGRNITPTDGFPDVVLTFSDVAPTATPLPSTWLILLTGFVGLGFFAYRGTKKNSAALAAA